MPARVMAELTLAVAGVALLGCALAANQEYLDRHVLPSFLLSRAWVVRLEMLARLVLAVLGLVLALVARPRVGRFVAREPARALQVVIAVALALVAGEAVLGRMALRPAEWLFPDEEPRRRADARLGWTYVPERAGRAAIGGRTIEYALDPSGYRVRRVDEPVDPGRPTVVLTGESVMFGEGLTWEESIPAQLGALLGVQSANLAVHGYGSDQAFMRLRAELPRFRRPVAVVSLFMPALFGRNLDDDRPHLMPGLVWGAGKPHARLTSLAQLLVPLRSDEAIERGITVTREVLQATARLARARGATPLVVVPQFGQVAPMEQTLRRRILDEAGVPYVLVALDPAWRLPWDRHPDARAARAIARAAAERLPLKFLPASPRRR